MKKDNDPSFDPDDTYGVFKSEMEVDSDVNEDMNRERLLDESVEAFIKSENELPKKFERKRKNPS
ncbi:hypothetical protein E1I69_23710 [Bacillus timonensis]|uniref:Uncharacterized protein n=1 Tax=Bacillus timonensis TaxID=1033734 RepID=A0A4S3PIG3_9BACI|nr:hypothetical protein [Bacillus timonensis]THE09099.1 hypothetical protein E1I69_23710 [Bacillus timonensis]